MGTLWREASYMMDYGFIFGKGRGKIYGVPWPGFGKISLRKKVLAPLFYYEKSLGPSYFYVKKVLAPRFFQGKKS